MSGSLATQDAARLAQHRQHVTVTDRGAAELDAGGAQRDLQPQIAHHRADDRSTQAARLLQRACDDVQQLVAVDDAPEMIDHDQAIAIAVQGETHVGAHSGDRELQQIGRHRAAAVIDVPAVGRAADRHDLRAEIGEDARTDLVGSAVGTVDHDFQSRQIETRRQRGGAELLVVRAHAVGTGGTTEIAGGARQRRLLQLGFDALLELVGELAPRCIEELDAVVVIEIVRGTDHDADIAIEAARHVGDAGGR